jgi:phenylpyruvate tautomerase PptA (4-oxalocrotonate tautomerase family)
MAPMPRKHSSIREVVMTIVTVEMWDKYTIDQKRQLVKDITDAFVKVGTAAGEVNIILRQNPRSCWAQGGKLCDDFQIPEGA